MLGSPAYMSPEQMQASKDVDARTDIWALGIILFELVTGRPPFESESMTGLAIKIATERLVSMRSLRADIPVGLDLVVEKCLEKDRTQRYSSIGELALALKSFAPEYARISVDRIVGTERRSIASVKNPRPPSVPGVPDEPPTLREIPTVAATMPAATDAWGKTGRGAAPSSRGARVAIVLFLASAALVASFAVATLRSKPPEVPPVGLVASGPSLPPSAEASAPAPSPPAPVTPPVARPSAEIVPEAPVVPRPPPRAAAPASRPASPPPSAKLGPSAAHSNCNPPYIVNAQGEHVYKPECL
jgi:serine/threonine-protein kinase